MNKNKGLKNAKTIKTVLHCYRFRLDNDKDAKQYHELSAKLRQSKRDFFNAFADTKEKTLFPENVDIEIELETNFLFNNQWNTACGKRVFDWYEGIYPNRSLKIGHYLDITEEMIAIRNNTLICGYCGKYYSIADISEAITIEGSHFCSDCLGSVYLKSKELCLLRLFPVSVHHKKDRQKLSEAEKAVLIPAYTQAQISGRNEREANYFKTTIEAEKEKRENKIAEIETKFKAHIWLLERGFRIDNVIFYSHKGQFCFEWQEKYDEIVKAKLKKALAEFPFSYYFKGEAND